MYDVSGNAIPIRWLAPECVQFSNDADVSLKSITKECNLWLVHCFHYSIRYILTVAYVYYG